MPVYEFLCQDCHRVFTFFARHAESTARRPKCPKCGRRRMGRLFSRFAALTGGRRAKEEESAAPAKGSDESFSPEQEARMEHAMASLGQDVDSIDENNPRQMASVMRRLSDATGEPIDAATDEMIRRLEAGEDPDRVEEALGDAFGDEGLAAGAGGMPSRDGGLYDL